VYIGKKIVGGSQFAVDGNADRHPAFRSAAISLRVSAYEGRAGLEAPTFDPMKASDNNARRKAMPSAL